MKTDFLKYYHPSVVVVLSIAVAGALVFLKEHFAVSLSILGITTLTLTSIASFTWKREWLKKVFILLFWVDDFSGRYEGYLDYQYRDDNGELHKGRLKHVKIINQSGSRITVFSFNIKDDGTKSSVSVSKGLDVSKTEDGHHFRITYFYQNDGCSERGFPPHNGTEVIKFIKRKNNKQLTGGYYTDRQPFQTKGEIKDLKWVSNELNHDF
tara:strand:- start:12116 stop:12745 length:630 start_codon:yes stop_codon:yes gene_type:complete